MATQFTHTYSTATIIMTKLALSGEIKISRRRELLALYVSALKVIYHRNRTAKHVAKMVRAQKKLNDLIDIGEFAAQLDTNL
jgi:hypothetical protein